MATATTYNPTYRYGETKPIAVPAKSGVAVNVGDLSFIDTGDSNTLKPAMSFTWTTDLATTQLAYAAVFNGVAAQAYDGTTAGLNAYGIQDGLLRLDTGGVYDYACASTAWVVGDLVAPAKDAASNNLAGQTVGKTTVKAAAIGECLVAGTLTTVRVGLFGNVAALTNQIVNAIA